MRKYIKRWLWRAYSGSYGFADLLSGFAGSAIAVIQHFWPAVQPAMNSLIWQVPLWSFATIMLTRLIMSPFWIAKEDAQKITDLESALEQSKDKALYSVYTKPHFDVARQYDHFMFAIGMKIISPEPIHFEVAELSATVNDVEMPSLGLVESRVGMVMPNELKWFTLPGLGLPLTTKMITGPLKIKLVFGPPSEPDRFFLEKTTKVFGDFNGIEELVISETRGRNKKHVA